MRKTLGIVIISLIFFNITLAQSSLPKCEGSDNKISEFSIEYHKLTRKWTNCQGIGIGPRGEKYIGEWEKGKFHGQGTFLHEGRKYVGKWKNGKKYGQGTYAYPNGDKYVGEWIKSKYGKKGTYIYANGDKYIGEWKKDEYHLPDNGRERNGFGTYIYANGDKYIGKWKKGLKHGKGTFTHLSGKIKKGIWKKDKWVK